MTFTKEQTAIILDALSHYSATLDYAMEHQMLSESDEEFQIRIDECKDTQVKTNHLITKFEAWSITLDILK